MLPCSSGQSECMFNSAWNSLMSRHWDHSCTSRLAHFKAFLTTFSRGATNFGLKCLARSLLHPSAVGTSYHVSHRPDPSNAYEQKSHPWRMARWELRGCIARCCARWVHDPHYFVKCHMAKNMADRDLFGSDDQMDLGRLILWLRHHLSATVASYDYCNRFLGSMALLDWRGSASLSIWTG